MIYATYSLVILALILCSAFFSLAEMSFLLASPVTLRHWAEDEDNRSAAVALGMLDDANRVLTTINIGDTIVNLAAVMLGTWFFFVYYSGQGIIVGVVVLFLAILIIGEILPRMIAQRYENRVFCRVAMPLKLLVTLLRPLTFIFGSGHVIMERAGREDDEEEYVEDELLNMLDEAESGGEMEARESDLIRSAINFEELLVKDILQPRVRVVAIDDEMDVREVLDVFSDTGYSRLPVYHDSIDNIERDFQENDHISLIIHYDPILTGDDAVGTAREWVKELVRSISPELSIHDFRMVQGPSHTNLIFDTVVPHNFPLSDAALRKRIQSLVETHDAGETKYYAVVTIDHSYVAIPGACKTDGKE